MDVIIQNSESDYQKFNKYYSFKRKLNFKIFLIILLALFYSGDNNGFILTNSLVKFSILTVVFSCIVFLLPYLIFALRLSKLLKTKKYFLEKTKITIIETGIRIDSDSYNTFWHWDAIKLVGNSKDYIFIFFNKDKSRLIIPKNFFTSESQANNFHGKIHIEVVKAKGILKDKSGKHLYSWGWIGIIPNFGFIAGLILLYKGLFNYKDKKLVVIGIADILFSIIFWSVLFYQMNHGDWFSDSNSKFAQTELNSIVKDIEFFKSQNGSYPESLYQFNKTDQLIFINDPFLLTNLDTMNRNFNYKKIRDKYTIFSVGVDRIPNTLDDIYPTVTNDDTIKFGFIKISATNNK